MRLITGAKIVDSKSKWIITIKDLGNSPGTRLHINPNKLNPDGINGSCRFIGCSIKFRKNRRSGLCKTHQIHQHSLFLELQDPYKKSITAPQHVDIVDKLIEWAQTRNYDLTPLFKSISFNILGNIPDVSTLSNDIQITGYKPPTLQSLANEITIIVDEFLPDYNNSSYQPLLTNKGQIPARILALTFAGLILCEEANRGDRWYNRMILLNESKTELLGGAMPIGYFAAKMFPWGVELGKASRRLVPNG